MNAAEIRERAEAAEILEQSADHVVRHGMDQDRNVIGAIAAVAFGDSTVCISARGGAADRARIHLLWHLGVRGFSGAQTATAVSAVRALRDAAASLRTEPTS